MTITGEERTPASQAPEASEGTLASPPGSAALAAVVIGVLAATFTRHGGFYPADAFGVVVGGSPPHRGRRGGGTATASAWPS